MRQPDPVKAVKLLDSLLRFFGKDGEHWTRGKFFDDQGARCLVGALDNFHWKRGIPPATAGQYLSAAIRLRREPRWPRRREPRYSPGTLIWFNDRCRGFDSIRAVILQARALAQRDAEKWPEMIAEAKAALAKQQEAEARKRQLIAELERERMVRHAAGDTRPTYILCPRLPAPHPEPLKLAA